VTYQGDDDSKDASDDGAGYCCHGLLWTRHAWPPAAVVPRRRGAAAVAHTRSSSSPSLILSCWWWTRLLASRPVH